MSNDEKSIIMNAKASHLSNIQGVITRMGSNSFLIKSGEITFLVWLYGAFINEPSIQWKNKIFLLFVILLITIFTWLFDAYFLRLERGFRNYYNEINNKKLDEFKDNYDFSIVPREMESIFKIAISRPVLILEYGMVSLVTVILIAFETGHIL